MESRDECTRTCEQGKHRLPALSEVHGSCEDDHLDECVASVDAFNVGSACVVTQAETEQYHDQRVPPEVRSGESSGY